MNDTDLDRALTGYGTRWRAGFEVPDLPADPVAPQRPRRWRTPLAVAAAVAGVLVAATLLLPAGGSNPRPAAPTVDAVAAVPPATIVLDGQTLFLRGTTPVLSAVVDERDAPRIRVDAGMDFRGNPAVSDCFPAAAAFVVAQSEQDVRVVAAEYSPSEQVPENLPCQAPGAGPYQLALELDEPLGERALIDVEAGPVAVVTADDLPAPTDLPDGFTGGELYVPEVDDEGVFPERSYDGPDQQALFLQRRPVGEVDQGDIVVLEAVVHGQRAVVSTTRNFEDSLCVRWDEADVGLRLCNVGSPTAALDPQTLIRIAESMPPIPGVAP